ncbi:unnamed protein product [Clavelina lepadiformis]|uniref:Metalloendopeptidase n=1 Tax=Clavelina lepadiformis TaxID=159417 RepID=A0ABP0FX00_CLALP
MLKYLAISLLVLYVKGHLEDVSPPIGYYEINEEIDQKTNDLKPDKECPSINGCANFCMLGYAKDSDGCKTCKCITRARFEGDIDINEGNIQQLQAEYGKSCAKKQQRGAVSKDIWQWPKEGDTVTIPYEFDLVSVSDDKQFRVKLAIQEYDRKTCIRFVPRAAEKDYIKILGYDGCSSSVGRQGGAQDLKLGEGCDARLGTIIHEFMHAIGFWHEHSRGDRDEHIEIKWENIKADREHNFEKRTSAWDSFSSPYDYESVMHYGGYFFAISNSQPTIIDKRSNQPVSHQREGFSIEDVKQINRKYECLGYEGYEKTFTESMQTTRFITTPAPCEDKTWYCKLFSGKGYCNMTYETYMKLNCAKTCGHCSTGETMTTTPTTIMTTTSSSTTTTAATTIYTTPNSTTVIEECSDQDWRCKTWATLNFCNEKYVEYMTMFCPESCSLCSSKATTALSATTTPTTMQTTPGACMDKHTNCKHWASFNFCNTKYVDYMTINCRESCGLCPSTDLQMSLPEKCTDEYTMCGFWAKNGYCTLEPFSRLMKEHCKKSCNYACSSRSYANEEPLKSCSDLNSYCPWWAEQNMCNGSYKVYMAKHCKQSCNLCTPATTISTTTLLTTGRSFPLTTDISQETCGQSFLDEQFGSFKRIVGGTNAIYGSIPWIVSLHLNNGKQICGGTLINHEYVVTAAHCFYVSGVIHEGVDTMFGYLGKHHRIADDKGQLKVTFSSYEIHPDYDDESIDNDIAVLKLSSPIKFSKYIRPACLPDQGENVASGSTAVVSGWGATKRGVYLPDLVLQKVEVVVIEHDECNDWLKPYFTAYGHAGLTSNMFCAGYKNGQKDACQGDSGGPLIFSRNNRQVLVGIVSWGYGCAQTDRPGVYTQVAGKVDWINEVIQKK